jgi:predicted ATPase
LWETIPLKPFTLAETSALVAHILVSDLAHIIHEQSKGNPLFVSEISHWIKTTRKISAEDLGKVLTESDILQKLVLSSLEGLTEVQRDIARAASVIGDEFRISQVQALMEAKLDPVTLSNNLSEAGADPRHQPAEAGVDARYAFQQSLVRDVLYNSLPFARRREAACTDCRTPECAPLSAQRAAQPHRRIPGHGPNRQCRPRRRNDCLSL